MKAKSNCLTGSLTKCTNSFTHRWRFYRLGYIEQYKYTIFTLKVNNYFTEHTNVTF